MLRTVTRQEDKIALHDFGIAQPRPLRLNLGCGNDWMGLGVINIDCRNLIPPDGMVFLRADLADLRHYFEEGCASEVWAKDVLEHFPQAEAPKLLAAWCRLLRPGGTLHLKAPDLYALARYILEGTDPDETKAYRVYGGQSYSTNFHTAGLTVPMLTAWLAESGVDGIEAATVEGTNLLLTGTKRAG